MCSTRALASPYIAIWLYLAAGAKFWVGNQRGFYDVPLENRGVSFSPYTTGLIVSAPSTTAFLTGNSPHQLSWPRGSWSNLDLLRSSKAQAPNQSQGSAVSVDRLARAWVGL